MYIGREPCLVRPHNALKPGQMVISQSLPYKNRRELNLSPCSEKIPAVCSATLHVNFEENANYKGEVCCDYSTQKSILNILAQVPLKCGRAYPMAIPVPSGADSKDIKWVHVEVKVEPAGKDAKTVQGPFLINKNTTIHITGNVGYDSRHLRRACENSYPVERDVYGFPTNNQNNFAHLNPGLFRRLSTHARVVDPSTLLCKIGGYHYYCRPTSAVDSADEPIETNELASALSKHTPISPSNELLQEAQSCHVELSWFKGKQSLPLDADNIKRKVRQAMRQIPLEKGRTFLIPISDDDSQFVVQGCVTEVRGAQDSGQLFRVTDSTDLCLKAGDPVLLQGGEVTVRVREEILAELKEGLSGVDAIGQQLYDDVIVPMMQYRTGKSVNPPRGILFTGPPGIGKTALAKNLIKVLSRRFNCEEVTVGSQFVDSTGKSTAAMMDVLEHRGKGYLTGINKDRRHTIRFAIAFMDEIDALVLSGKPGAPASDSQRAFNSGLTKLMSDGAENMMFVATTNLSPDDFKPALMRAKRFDLIIPVENPDQDQREEILRKKLTDTGYDIRELDIRDMARQTGGSSAALDTLVNNIKSHACRREAKPGSPLTFSDIVQATIRNAEIDRHYKHTLKKISDKDRESPLLASEVETMEQLKKAVTRVQGKQVGKHTVICVHGKEARAGALIHHLLKQVKADSSAQDGSYKKLPFNKYALIPPESSEMIDETSKALEGKVGNLSLVVVNGAENLCQLKSFGPGPDLVGNTWKQVAGADNKSTALILVFHNESDIDQLMEKLHLSSFGVDERITFSSVPCLQDYREILNKKAHATPEAKTALLDAVCSNTNLDIQQFEHIISLHEEEDEDGKVVSWNIQGIQRCIASRKRSVLPMYT